MSTHEFECLPAEHKFEGRYDHKQPDMIDSLFSVGREGKDKIYVCDVCTRCGKTVSRDESERKSQESAFGEKWKT